MTLADLLIHAAGDLRQTKLRAGLTIMGVIIAIAAFVSMLSFGAGMQENVTRQFNELGLFRTIQAYPARDAEGGDSARAVLNDSVVAWLAALPGVELAYPYNDFSVEVQMHDTTLKSSAQAFPLEALQTPLFSHYEAGRGFSSDSAHGVVVTDEFVKAAKGPTADSMIGQSLIVSVKVPSLDSGLAHVIRDRGGYIWQRLDSIRYDSLRVSPAYRRHLFEREVGGALNRFVAGYMSARVTISDTLEVTGVLKSSQGRSRVGPVIIPMAVGRMFSQSGFTGDPADLLSGGQIGELFVLPGQQSGKNYPKVTLILDSETRHIAITDSVKAHGFRPFSYAAEFEDILKFFLYFKMGLGLIGLIALTTASLGIVNTMVMSILERRREIGLLKSLGADAGEIRRLFLVESGVIGSVGAIGGILLGWGISRIASAVAKAVMENKGVEPLELFALPLWLIGAAFGIGLVVSLMAGYYPASRAANLDPVEALRNE